jgi:hypothetical protein
VLESFDAGSVRPYGDGSYEWVTGTATFAVDPAAPGNDRIVDLDAAAPDDDGRVRFEGDVRLLRPVVGRGERALVVVPNRGMLLGLPFSVDATPSFGPEPPDPGDGFLLARGWTVAWCGWQWDVPEGSGLLGLRAPVARVPPGRMRIEFRLDAPAHTHALSDSSPLFTFADYPTADVIDPDAVLSLRVSPMGPKQVVPREKWRFVDEVRIELDGGFRPFHYYELVYRCGLAPVVGTGLLALRDLGSYLRRSHRHLFAFGVSQSGRLLRELLATGLNVDEAGRPVFDGVFCHIAGARRGEFNIRHGQPSLTHTLTPGYGPPHDTTALLAVQRAIGGTPKVLLTNSAWEYWRGDGALAHQDALTGADLPEDPDARVHLLAGSDHFGRVPLLKETLPVSNPTHDLDVTPLLRALLVQLEAWVCDGTAPPPSRVPRRADGTAVTREEVLTSFCGMGMEDAAQPGAAVPAAVPDAEHLPYTPVIDPRSTTWPLEVGAPLVALVSSVDETGNEAAGVRLPAVSAPVAAYTGWNPRVHVDGLPDVLYEFAGSRLPRAAGAVTADRAAYAERVRADADALAADRFLLPVDVTRVVEEAMRLYDDGPGRSAPTAG